MGIFVEYINAVCSLSNGSHTRILMRFFYWYVYTNFLWPLWPMFDQEQSIHAHGHLIYVALISQFQFVFN